MYQSKNKQNHQKYVLAVILVLCVSLISSCTPQAVPEQEETDLAPTKPAAVASITVLPDESYEEFFVDDPYSQISKYTMEVYQPDQALYNYLFNGVMDQKASVDISGFNLTNEQIMNTSTSLYSAAGFQLYYLRFVRWSQDYKTISFVYYDELDAVEQNQVTFYAHMNHLLNNVAPEEYTQLQKFFFVYDYLTKRTGYTDKMEDQTTHSPYSLLVKGKGICGGYALLADYALNHLGIPTEYLSNEPHAWNLVELNGNRYHTDFTWGASYGDNSRLYTVLMDDQARNDSLDYAGFGGYEIISGFPRMNPEAPEPATDARYAILNTVNSHYAMDIANGWIYFSDYEAIYRIDLDGSNLITVEDTPGENLISFNGILYYRDGREPTKLYKLVPGQAPQLLDDSIEIDRMQLSKGVLWYGRGEDKTMGKSIDLTEFKESGFPHEASNHLEAISIPKHKTFSLQITFEQEMDTQQGLWQLIGLVTEKGQTIPLHMLWSEDQKVLTLRSQENLSEEGTVTLYIDSGLKTKTGQFTEESYDISVNLE